MLKTGLSVAHFRRYVPLIEKETIDYFQRWGDSGVKGDSCTMRHYVKHIVLYIPGKIAKGRVG